MTHKEALKRIVRLGMDGPRGLKERRYVTTKEQRFQAAVNIAREALKEDR